MPPIHRLHARDRPPPARARTGPFAMIVIAQGLGLAAAALLVVGMPRLLTTQARVAAVPVSTWRQHCADLRAQAAAVPGDTGSRLRLAEALICQALWDGQDRLQQSEWASAADDRTVYHAYLNAALEGAAEIAEARSIVNRITASDPDPKMRARAWERLASLAALEEDDDARSRCAEAARRVATAALRMRGARHPRPVLHGRHGRDS